jgi:hypothetical protein
MPALAEGDRLDFTLEECLALQAAIAEAVPALAADCAAALAGTATMQQCAAIQAAVEVMRG